MENEKDMVETPAGENIVSPAGTVASENVPAAPVEEGTGAGNVQEETCCCCCSDEKDPEETSCCCSCEGADEADEADENADEEKEERKARRERVVIPITPEMVDKTRVALVTMLDFLGLEGTVKAEGHTSKINLYVTSEDAGRIIGRKGQTLESLQLILNKMMQKENPDFPKVYIDLDGYASRNERKDRAGDRAERSGKDKGEHSSRRRSFDDRGGRRNSRRDFGDGNSEMEDNLRQQALDAAKEVRRWGEAKTLPPMNSHDRRIIHITLENEADLVTESSGDGAMKSVTISLKK
ncbi:MAG: KH domain-containing protein [Lentisphaeria bacterium]|nr:KH domain-containing protein [Lentisphaeria bacterium]